MIHIMGYFNILISTNKSIHKISSLHNEKMI
jgi:hypothetical protein